MAIVLILLFLMLPIAELYVIVELSGWIGIWPTLALLVIDSLLGAFIVRAQGRAAWLRFNETLRSGRVPAKETYDGIAIILGGALLLTPGFITDLFGFFLLVPGTRALLSRFGISIARRYGPARSILFAYERFPGRGPSPGPNPPPTGDPRATPGPPPPASRDYDIDGDAREIVDDERELRSGER